MAAADDRRTKPGSETQQRYADGWRAGKPEEDPEKLKKWGRVTARPSEYLVHMRRGVLLPGSSGQGASCWKWPWDAVAVVPTTVQQLRFVADQVTQEKVGVQVTGIAVYRIADPVIAYRMLNFSFPERASEKLAQLLNEMFVGAARRLVANLSVEECLQRRKEGIAEELMREIAPVVSGKGRLEDATDRGWGVVLDTIEIQDVRVQSPTVFANMQARFRHEQERRAREAELAKDEALQSQETDNDRRMALQKISSETEVRGNRASAEEQAKLAELQSQSRVLAAKVETERTLQAQRLQAELEKLATETKLKEQKAAAEERARLADVESAQRLIEAKLMQERVVLQARLAAELEKLQAASEEQAARHASELAVADQTTQLERARRDSAVARGELLEEELRLAELEAQKKRVLGAVELERATRMRELQNTVSAEAIRMTVAHKLPETAMGFAQKMGTVNVASIEGGNPFGYIASAVQGVMGLAKAAGLDVPFGQAGDEKGAPGA